MLATILQSNQPELTRILTLLSCHFVGTMVAVEVDVVEDLMMMMMIAGVMSCVTRQVTVVVIRRRCVEMVQDLLQKLKVQTTKKPLLQTKQLKYPKHAHLYISHPKQLLLLEVTRQA